jgi:pSer/pThr/pTyr-binding forkhead associated (FHA) protein
MPLPSRDSTATSLGAERAGIPFLAYRGADGAQRLLELTGERLSVGRGAGADLALTWDREASRVHALLERLAGSWTVVDDGLSRNGTFVNGVRVSGRRRLRDRDVLLVGSTQLLFRDPAAAADETPLATGPAILAAVTPAQRRVLVALCRPLAEARQTAVPPSNSEVADELTLSVEAVRTHMKALFKLFEVPDLPQNRKRAELARRALASGVVSAREAGG